MILAQDKEIKAGWKYRMPFFLYKGNMVCYFWVNKKLQVPYIGIVEEKKINHPDLIIEKRSRMKTLLVDPFKDLPKRKINSILKETVDLYRKGIVKVYYSP